MLYGYARVSTLDQDTTMQIDALKRAGIESLFSESCSGAGPRPVLRQLLELIGPGDTLVVWKIDRIARSLGDLLGILKQLDHVGAGMRSLTEPIDTSTPLGEFMLQILGAVAQLERAMIRERVVAGQVASLMRGTQFGRKPSTTPEQDAEIVKLRLEGLNMSQIARRMGISRWPVVRVVSLHEDPENVRWKKQRPVCGPIIERLR